ncbi:MAG: hypothetical protein IKG58_01785 [Bacilli bacterium]|nr:hypothetical protein [Bacilli bacterium]MBR3049277.1 hypothetical protein [Bacilli bacterium]
MNLIEKKCPCCGGTLEFKDNDRSCRCEYCKKSFVIEKEANSNSGVDQEYDYQLNIAPSPFRAFFYIAFCLILVLVLFVFGLVFSSMFS